MSALSCFVFPLPGPRAACVYAASSPGPANDVLGLAPGAQHVFAAGSVKLPSSGGGSLGVRSSKEHLAEDDRVDPP